MKGDIERIRKSRKVLDRGNKSNNIYQVSPHEYEQILNNKITESCNIDHTDTPKLINKDTAKFSSKLQIVHRLGKIEEKCTNISFKDHKQNFQDKKRG